MRSRPDPLIRQSINTKYGAIKLFLLFYTQDLDVTLITNNVFNGRNLWVINLSL